MTTLALDLVRKIQGAEPAEAWRKLFAFVWQTCSGEVSGAGTTSEMLRRDRAVASADLFLATAGWDLWSSYYDNVPRTADRLAAWWSATPPGRAALILDALSVREAPWLVRGATERGYSVHSEVTGAELPADTNSFAQAMGFGHRSALENDGSGSAHRLPGARTDTVDLPWQECVDLLDAAPDWVLWHHWPDHRIHDLSTPGSGLSRLAKEVASQLADDHFWALIERLTTGRRLVITGDHGYASTGLFSDTADKQQSRYMKERFKSGRSASGRFSPGSWVPPIDLVLETPHGPHAFVLGRRKWRSPGGYPTLAHGGLSLLEVAVPFIEMSRPSGN